MKRGAIDFLLDDPTPTRAQEQAASPPVQPTADIMIPPVKPSSSPRAESPTAHADIPPERDLRLQIEFLLDDPPPEKHSRGSRRNSAAHRQQNPNGQTILFGRGETYQHSRYEDEYSLDEKEEDLGRDEAIFLSSPAASMLSGRPRRQRMNQDQLRIMENFFGLKQLPSAAEKRELASMLKLTPTQVHNW